MPHGKKAKSMQYLLCDTISKTISHWATKKLHMWRLKIWVWGLQGPDLVCDSLKLRGSFKRYPEIGDHPKKVLSNPPKIEPQKVLANPLWPPKRFYGTLVTRVLRSTEKVPSNLSHRTSPYVFFKTFAQAFRLRGSGLVEPWRDALCHTFARPVDLIQDSQRRKIHPKKSTQNKNVHLNKFFLNNFRRVSDSRHREEGKSSRELFRKTSRERGVVGILGFWVGVWASRFRQTTR